MSEVGYESGHRRSTTSVARWRGSTGNTVFFDLHVKVYGEENVPLSRRRVAWSRTTQSYVDPIFIAAKLPRAMLAFLAQSSGLFDPPGLWLADSTTAMRSR